MSKLQELIQKLCPDGVEFKRLGDQQVCVMQRGTVITKNNIITGEIPVIAGGKNPAYYCNQANRTGEIITIAGSGAYAGFVSYWNTPIFVSDAFSIKGAELCSTKYLYYLLLNMQDKIYATKKGAGIPHVHIKDVENFKIPIPHLEVQNEIVRILDTFTSHTAELQAELQARKEQYEYYRNKLLTFDKDDKNVKWMKLGEVYDIKAGKGIPASEISSKRTGEKRFPCYGGNGLRGYVSLFNQEGGKVLIGRQGALCGNVNFAEDQFYATEHAIVVSDRGYCLPHYTFYLLIIMNLNQYKTAGAQPGLSVSRLEKVLLPIPSISEQQRIVSILDKFEALVNGLTEGIPAEIAAVQEQYEYYRNKLLTFKQK